MNAGSPVREPIDWRDIPPLKGRRQPRPDFAWDTGPVFPAGFRLPRLESRDTRLM